MYHYPQLFVLGYGSLVLKKGAPPSTKKSCCKFSACVYCKACYLFLEPWDLLPKLLSVELLLSLADYI